MGKTRAESERSQYAGFGPPSAPRPTRCPPRLPAPSQAVLPQPAAIGKEISHIRQPVLAPPPSATSSPSLERPART